MDQIVYGVVGAFGIGRAEHGNLSGPKVGVGKIFVNYVTYTLLSFGSLFISAHVGLRPVSATKVSQLRTAAKRR
jgi:hypothetical protein